MTCLSYGRTEVQWSLAGLVTVLVVFCLFEQEDTGCQRKDKKQFLVSQQIPVISVATRLYFQKELLFL